MALRFKPSPSTRSATKQELIETLTERDKALQASVKREATLKSNARNTTAEVTAALADSAYYKSEYDRVYRDYKVATRRKETVEELLREARNERTRLKRALYKATEGAEPTPLNEAQKEIVGIAERVFLNGPDAIVLAVREIVADRSMQDALMLLMDRRSELSSDEAMLFAGIGMNPLARKHFDQALDKHWNTGKSFNDLFGANQARAGEVIIGAGVHGSIFAAVRHRKTGVKPIVIDMGRAGGSFAVTSGPAFYLNSRNRPGPLSIPGDEFGALNVIPGAPIQPSEIGGEEYLTNDALAWAIRTSLLMHAQVHTGIEITDAQPFNSSRSSIYSGRESSSVGSAAFATGLSRPRKLFGINSERYLTFPEFFKRMDQPFPLRGMARVAVLGAGDGGKTVIEALTGQGPTSAMTVPTLDYVRKIDWYGVPTDQMTRETWEACNRSRYKGIGRLLPDGQRPFRVMPLNKPTYGDMGYDCIKIDGMPYDYVIDCTGYNMQSIASLTGGYEFRENDNGQSLGKRNSTLYSVGPGAQLDPERYEPQVLGNVGENTTSIWRYADRTARLAEAV